jgi:hypothetical protein
MEGNSSKDWQEYCRDGSLCIDVMMEISESTRVWVGQVQEAAQRSTRHGYLGGKSTVQTLGILPYQKATDYNGQQQNEISNN